MDNDKALSVGDRVHITHKGVLAHQKHHDDHVNVVAKAPMPIAGAIAAEAVAETAKQIIFTFPEPGWKGTIVEIRERWWWQSGYDYLVRWDADSGQSWHLSKHLLLIK